MPDLVTHTILTRFIATGKWRKFSLWLLIGSVLPDLLTRAPMFFLRNCYTCGWFFAPLHTPLVLLLVSLLIASFFRGKKELFSQAIFCSVFLGSVLHMLLDLFQKHIKPGYYYLFPFSFDSFEVGLFWPEDSLQLLPYLAGLFVVFLIVEKAFFNRNK